MPPSSTTDPSVVRSKSQIEESRVLKVGRYQNRKEVPFFPGDLPLHSCLLTTTHSICASKPFQHLLGCNIGISLSLSKLLRFGSHRSLRLHTVLLTQFNPTVFVPRGRESDTTHERKEVCPIHWVFYTGEAGSLTCVGR